MKNLLEHLEQKFTSEAPQELPFTRSFDSYKKKGYPEPFDIIASGDAFTPRPLQNQFEGHAHSHQSEGLNQPHCSSYNVTDSMF